MERLRVSATRSNLIRIKEELRFAREGKDLLTQKREVLVMEMLRLQDDARQAREELNALLAAVYQAFSTAAMLEGFNALERLSMASPPPPGIDIRVRRVMGVAVPIVEGRPRDWRPSYGLAVGSSESDRTIRLLLEAQGKIMEVAEIETAIYRLAMETRKTLRRERALENLFIPQYAETVKFIQDSLEEKEREGFFQLKLVKGKRGTA
jgi:V/A-type H+/Na+-transporting ATPase subunit D